MIDRLSRARIYSDYPIVGDGDELKCETLGKMARVTPDRGGSPTNDTG